MRKKMVNECHISGYLYEHNLERKVTGAKSKNPNTEYIRGDISIATDNAMTNIVKVYYTYVTEKTSTGKPNSAYTVLSNIIDNAYGTVMKDGADRAIKVRVDCSLALNEFYTDRNGNEELVSAKRNEGGFIHVADTLEEDENTRSTFKVDMIITGVKHIDADEERGYPEKAIIKGAIFDFRKALLPVEFSAVNPNAISYFESLGASANTPVFTQLWGRQVSTVVVKRLVQESAFGDDDVREVKNTRKDFVVTGSLKQEYEWDTEETITIDEFRTAISDRETHLATLKQNREDYKASQNTVATPTKGGFNF